MIVNTIIGVAGMFIPIAICVILPISIVWIIFHAHRNEVNKRTSIIIKAIESNNSIDATKLAESFARPRKTPQEQLQSRLSRGCICSLIGVALIILSLVPLLTDSQMIFTDNNVFVPFMGGSICMAIGLAYLIVYFVTRKQVADNSNNNQK